MRSLGEMYAQTYTVLEMRNIRTERPDISLFDMPEGYTRDREMEGMIQGMMGGQ